MTPVPRHDTVVYLGPSLPLERARALLDVEYRPPVRAGDVYRLLATRVKRIVIVDGLFHGARSIWHRELIDALDEGIELIGASSMGALRAAELHDEGMLGIGTVFDWYRSSEVSGDDEVALLHADEDGQFRPISEPLVNLRATLRATAERGDLDAQTIERLLARAIALHYSERSYPALIRPVEPAQRDRVASALRRCRRDLKGEDAAAALTFCRNNPVRPRATPRPPDEASRWWTARHLKVGITCNDQLHTAGEALARFSSDAERLGAARLEAAARLFAIAGAELRAPIVSETRPASPAEGALRQGLTPIAFHRLSAARAILDSLIVPQDDPIPGNALFFDGAKFSADSTAATVTRARSWILEWCRAFGVECPADFEQRYLEAWSSKYGLRSRPELQQVLASRALSDWVVLRGPEFFGLRCRTDIEVLHDLQLRGLAAELLEVRHE